MADTAKKTAPAKKAATKKTAAKKTSAAKSTSSSTSSRSSVKKGDQVQVQVNPLQNNGDPEAFGFVVGVDESGSPTMVDVKVVTNSDDNVLLRNVALLTKAEAKKKDAPAKHAVRA